VSELREILAKHKAADADKLRRVAALITGRKCDQETLEVGLYLCDQARKIDAAFAKSNVMEFRGKQPEPPEAA